MVSNDRLFDALADRKRRLLLLDLLHDEPRPVPSLSSASREVLAAHDGYLAEYLSSSMDMADVDKEAVRVHHVHLPKLVGYGYVEWDEEDHLLSQGADFDDLRPLLELLDDDGDDRDDPSGGAAALLLRSKRLRPPSEPPSTR